MYNDLYIPTASAGLRAAYEVLCDNGMAYEDMEGRFVVHEWARDFAEKYLKKATQAILQPSFQPTIMNITVNGTANIFEAGSTNNLVFNIAHTDSVSVPAPASGASEHADTSVQEDRPEPKNYKALIRWIEREKQEGRDWYRDADFNRTRMCRTLSEHLGWEVDQSSLRKAQERTAK